MKKILYIAILLTAFCASSCFYDKEHELYPINVTCDTISLTYSNQVKKIIDGYCVSCHFSGNPTGFDLDTWAGLNAVANTYLMGTVKHEQGFNEMPPSTHPLDACKIRQLQLWVNSGAPNN
jgi:hypothetical protein